MMSSEKYKDIQWVDKNGVRTKTWYRIKVDDVAAAVENAKQTRARHIFTTIQTFFKPKREDNEEVIMPFFLDLDAKTAKDIPTTAELKVVLADVCKVVEYFNGVGLNTEYLSIWWSGKKGFHITVPVKFFGALPSPDLHKIWRLVGKHIAVKTGITTFDETVYSCRRMWRVENTINSSAEPPLYKIPLGIEELKTLTIGEIQALAMRPQVSHVEEYEGEPQKLLRELYIKCRDGYDLNVEPGRYKPVDVHFTNPPPCIVGLLENGVLRLGTTNMTMFRLAAFFKSQDVTMSETVVHLNAWVEQIKPTHTHELTPAGVVNLKQLRNEVMQVCKSVYSSDTYNFSCSGIKQIPGIKDFCKKDCEEKVEGRTEVSLFDARHAQYLGKRIWFVAEAVGRRDMAYAIPESIKTWCTPNNTDLCATCPLFECSDGMITEVSAKSKVILSFLLPSKLELVGKIGRLVGLPNRKKGCGRWNFKITPRNAEIIFLAPKIVNRFDKSGRYTRTDVFFLGYGLEPNKAYEFTGYSHIHEQNNTIHIVVDKARPVEDSLSSFKFLKAMQKDSKIFCPEAGQSYTAKHDDIAKKINLSVVRVWGREDLIKAIDLAYHSVNAFQFQREIINGRFDLCVVGDTRQGKSKVITSLMEHFDLGVKVSGESAKRTGLLYTIPTKESEASYIAWGVLPRHTRRLVFIDEANAFIENGGFAELTEVRSSGEVVVAQTVYGRAKVETRLVTLTNAKGPKTLGTYNYPVLALRDLFKDTADISRFTFVIGVASSQVADEIINQNIEDMKQIENPYKTTVCHNHILWIWSLEPEQIILDKEIEKMILKLSNYMCSEYVASVQLVEPGDFRHKLAKVAVAAAARMNSADKDRLVVTPEAVEYAYEFINKLYMGSPLKYREYSIAYAASALSEDAIKRLVAEMKQRWIGEWEGVIKWLMFNEYTGHKEVALALQYAEKEVKECLQWMSAHRLLNTTSRGHFSKTELGVKFVDFITPEQPRAAYRSATEVIDGGKDDGY